MTLVAQDECGAHSYLDHDILLLFEMSGDDDGGNMDMSTAGNSENPPHTTDGTNRGGVESTSECNGAENARRHRHGGAQEGRRGTTKRKRCRPTRKKYQHKNRKMRVDGMELLIILFGDVGNTNGATASLEKRFEKSVENAVKVKEAYDYMVSTGFVPEEYVRRSSSRTDGTSALCDVYNAALDDITTTTTVTFTTDEVKELYSFHDDEHAAHHPPSTSSVVDPAILKEYLIGMVQTVCDTKAFLATVTQNMTTSLTRMRAGGRTAASREDEHHQSPPSLLSGRAASRALIVGGGLNRGPFEDELRRRIRFNEARARRDEELL